MSKPDAETVELLRNISTEIGAGKVMVPRSYSDIAHNNACDRALTIIADYARGEGLFQMTRKSLAQGARPRDAGGKQ